MAKPIQRSGLFTITIASLTPERTGITRKLGSRLRTLPSYRRTESPGNAAQSRALVGNFRNLLQRPVIASACFRRGHNAQRFVNASEVVIHVVHRHRLIMPNHKQIRESLDWARQSREQWKVAYDQAKDEHPEDADFAAKQIAMFDRMVDRFERFLEARNGGYKSG
jgi:hypothetical protein